MPEQKNKQKKKAGGWKTQYYVVELWGGHTPEHHEGPFYSEAEYCAAARKAHGEIDEGSILLLARVTPTSLELTSFRAGFFEEEAAA